MANALCFLAQAVMAGVSLFSSLGRTCFLFLCVAMNVVEKLHVFNL